MSMKKFVKIDYGYNIKIANHCSCSLPTIRRALRYETNHELAVKIREYALKECRGEICYIDK